MNANRKLANRKRGISIKLFWPRGTKRKFISSPTTFDQWKLLITNADPSPQQNNTTSLVIKIMLTLCLTWRLRISDKCPFFIKMSNSTLPLFSIQYLALSAFCVIYIFTHLIGSFDTGELYGVAPHICHHPPGAMVEVGYTAVSCWNIPQFHKKPLPSTRPQLNKDGRMDEPLTKLRTNFWPSLANILSLENITIVLNLCPTRSNIGSCLSGYEWSLRKLPSTKSTPVWRWLVMSLFKGPFQPDTLSNTWLCLAERSSNKKGEASHIPDNVSD